MPANLLIFIFWSSLAALFYTFLGYPLLIAGLSQLSRSNLAKSEGPVSGTTVSVVLAAYNEEKRIAARLKNLLASNYPAGRLDVIVVSDGSTDATVREIESFSDPRIRLLVQAQRQGKAAALNLALTVAHSELIVLADVRQDFAADAIAQLVRHFADPRVGAVSGELIINRAATAVGGGVDAYWRLEKFIRLAEARWDSSISCTGAIYAIRPALFQSLLADTILDDVVIPMQIAEKGFRVGFEPAAQAFDPQTLEPAREQVRKRRTLAGNYQMLFRQPRWLLPWRHRLWWQLISHKYLRLVAPFFLLSLAISNALLLPVWPYAILFYGQCAFYALAIGGLVFHSRTIKLLSLPAGFVFLNWMSFTALLQYLGNSSQTGWQSTPAQAPEARPQTRDV